MNKILLTVTSYRRRWASSAPSSFTVACPLPEKVMVAAAAPSFSSSTLSGVDGRTPCPAPHECSEPVPRRPSGGLAGVVRLWTRQWRLADPRQTPMTEIVGRNDHPPLRRWRELRALRPAVAGRASRRAEKPGGRYRPWALRAHPVAARLRPSFASQWRVALMHG